ncbi:retinol dehydrogenase 11-like [Macrosteles quadrilineatus]|uniref:retinol dehydrogenase 11-like n=1 Tax=Macrosteles quadrilineatus TaxID=74068 RepID=UPI0023E2FEEE|nr:retinol dehydrogenase 11-like [Macrosteles quadrilineatus]
MVLGIVYVIVPVVVVLGIVRKYREYTWGKCTDFNSLEGKVVLVTGANSGIGKETVKGLAIRKARVIMACRNLSAAKAVIEDIRKNVATGELIPMKLDLSSLRSVKSFAEEVLKDFPNIHVLINNAGVSVPVTESKKTEDGFEIHFGVNHLGHFLLTDILLEKLKKSSPSRVVVVSSTLHQSGVIDFDNLNGEKGFTGKVRNPGYCNSKLANAYFCQELARRTADTGVEVFAVCPGFCYTGLFRYSKVKWYQKVLFLPIAFFFMRSAAQGSQTVLHCAVSDSVLGTSGQFYRDCKPYKSTHNFDPEVGVKLWEVSENLISKTLQTK